MSNQKSCWSLAAYFIIGLIAISIAVKVIWWLVRLTVGLISIAVSVAIVAGVGYLVYLLIRAAINSGDTQ